MVVEADLNIENILLTLKKHPNQRFELLYLSTALKKFLNEGEKEMQDSFFERLMPTLDRPFFAKMFATVGSGVQICTPFVLNPYMFTFAQLEGCVIAQEDKSYLCNILIFQQPAPKEIHLSWLLTPTGEVICYEKNQLKKKLNTLREIQYFLLERFNFLNSNDLERFLQSEANSKFEIFSKQLFIKSEMLQNGHRMISICYGSADNELDIVDEEVYDQVIKQQSGAIYYEHEIGNKVVRWSGAIEKVLGYTQAEFKDFSVLDWSDLIHPDDRGSLITGFDEKLDLEQTLDVVYRMRNKAGEYIYVHDLAKPFFQSATGKMFVLGAIRDISELKQAEMDLLDNKSKLKELTGVVPGMVYMLKRGVGGFRQFMFVSEGSKQLFEVDASVFTDSVQSLIELIHPEDVEEVLRIDEESFLAGTKFESHFRIITPSGQTKWIYGASNKLEQYENEYIWAGFFIDITYTKEKETEAQFNYLKYRSLYEESPLAIIQFDSGGKIQGLNKRLLQKLKLDNEDVLVGKDLREILDGKPAYKAFQDALRTGEGFYEGPYLTYYHKIGYYVRITVKSIENSEILLATIEDLTEQEFIQNILNKVADISAQLKGTEFFNKLCELLTQRLGIRYCMIGEFLPKSGDIRTLAVAKAGQLLPNFNYPLEHTPCSTAIYHAEHHPVIIRDGVADEYYKDKMLADLKIVSYGAISILDAEDNKIGILTFMDDKPMENEENISKILKILGDRIGVEMQRVKYEQELVTTNHLQQAILNGADYAIFSVDNHFNINLINAKTLEIFNIDNKDQLLDIRLIDKNKLIRLKSLIAKASRSKNYSSYFHLPIPEGEHRELKISVVTLGDDRDSNYVIFADDITERTSAEKKLIESEQLYRSIAENFPKGTVDVLDKDLRYIYTEGKEYQHLGMNPKELIGSFHLLKYEAEVAVEAKTHLDAVLHGETVMYEITYGGQYYLKSGVPLTNADGEIDRILLVTQNITESKKSEKEREKLIKDLKSHNEELQRFAYIVSHNLRAPIVNISALLNLYDEEDPADPENKEVIENLKISTELLSATLMDLIEVVSIKKQKVPKVEHLSFQHVINNVERSLYQQIVESGVKITTDFKEAPDINYVYSHLENFFLNFLTNAIKYKHPERPPALHVESYKMGEFHVIAFSDNGIGLDLERYGDRLFGLYQRFHSHVDGKGLGLYLVREQIRAFDGDLTVESELGKGTTFKVFLKSMALKDPVTEPSINS
ncbi:PAS domain S-box protein [Litoribacter alkaliphilus]|uniref:histidine kinase n=1 Tax=Litoribacter ruber TaxID=702568 RepID=A0AAP2G144_9BACT|nr:PAS domain S-box protein [Litoribacter alkaliphilus]MBS9523507.1 PAS domain S-box protein [Litoribacter alkaliphilus]